jgi:hypothetical protein
MDCRGLGCEDQQDWLVAPCATNRDAGCFQEANWEAQLEILKGLPSSDPPDYEIHRFGHWANGWFEIVLVRPGSPAEKACLEMEACLADYPVLDDCLLGEKEHAAVLVWWGQMRVSQRVEELHKARLSGRGWRSKVPPEKVYDRLMDRLEG